MSYKKNEDKGFLKSLGDSILHYLKDLGKIVLISLIAFLIIVLILTIVFFSISTKFSKDKLSGYCIEANEFGSQKDLIYSYPLDPLSYSPSGNINYKHEEVMQRVVIPTDLGLSLNGEPVTIDITGQWSPWSVNASGKPKTNSMNGFEHIKYSILDENAKDVLKVDDMFLCALEKVDAATFGFKSIIQEEREFYYIKNYFSDVNVYTNKGEKSEMFRSRKLSPNEKMIVGIENLPERQKNCWLTRGFGLYLGVYGISGNVTPNAYHHILADKLVCNSGNWFGGKNGFMDQNDDAHRTINGSDSVLFNYKKVNSYDFSKCKEFYNFKSGNVDCTKISDIIKDTKRGFCYQFDKNDKKNYVYDCRVTENKIYTYSDFVKNYFSLSYHVKNTSEVFINYDGNGEKPRDYIIFDIKGYEDALKSAGVKEYPYIIADSTQKFMSACFEETRDKNGKYFRNYLSFFRYGPKELKKYYVSGNIKNNDNKYDRGSKIKMFILDKYYVDNDGFYKIDVISGIDLDTINGVEKKLQQVEYFLLGTPRPGRDNDRVDGVVAKIFNNIIKSNFNIIVRISLLFVVIFYGFKVLFGFKNGRESLIDKKYLLTTIVKISILITLLSPSGFNFFNKTFINFFINGTNGLIDIVSSVFDNSFYTDSSLLSINSSSIKNNYSFSNNFALIDEIVSFFSQDALMIKVSSFFFSVKQYPFTGILISAMLLAVFVFYLIKIASCLVPFVIILLSLAVILPLAPFFMFFSLFKMTESFFKKWLNAVISKCLELFAFFTAFFVYTSILTNIIKELLNFRVCFEQFGDYLINTNNIMFSPLKLILKPIKLLLNNVVIPVKYDNSDKGLNLISFYSNDNSFLFYFVNCMLVILLLILFNNIINIITNLVSSIVVVNDASADGSMSSSGSFSGQLSNFVKGSGLMELQNSSESLQWTKSIYDINALNKDLGKKPNNFTRLVSRTGNLGKAVLKPFFRTQEEKESGKTRTDVFKESMFNFIKYGDTTPKQDTTNLFKSVFNNEGSWLNVTSRTFFGTGPKDYFSKDKTYNSGFKREYENEDKIYTTPNESIEQNYDFNRNESIYKEKLENIKKLGSVYNEIITKNRTLSVYIDGINSGVNVINEQTTKHLFDEEKINDKINDLYNKLLKAEKELRELKDSKGINKIRSHIDLLDKYVNKFTEIADKSENDNFNEYDVNYIVSVLEYVNNFDDKINEDTSSEQQSSSDTTELISQSTKNLIEIDMNNIVSGNTKNILNEDTTHVV